MKGLIIKDCCNLKSIGKIIAILAVFYFVAGIGGSSQGLEMGIGFFSTFLILIPITVFSYDENCNWDVYAVSLPIKKKELVLEKYIFGIIAVVICAAINILIGVVSNSNMEVIMRVSAILAMLGVVIQAVFFPMVIKFGSDKSRYILLAIMMLAMMIFMFCGDLLQKAERTMEYYSKPAGIGAFAVVAVMYILSVKLSIKIYEDKEL